MLASIVLACESEAECQCVSFTTEIGLFYHRNRSLLLYRTLTIQVLSLYYIRLFHYSMGLFYLFYNVNRPIYHVNRMRISA